MNENEIWKDIEEMEHEDRRRVKEDEDVDSSRN